MDTNQNMSLVVKLNSEREKILSSCYDDTVFTVFSKVKKNPLETEFKIIFYDKKVAEEIVRRFNNEGVEASVCEQNTLMYIKFNLPLSNDQSSSSKENLIVEKVVTMTSNQNLSLIDDFNSKREEALSHYYDLAIAEVHREIEKRPFGTEFEININCYDYDAMKEICHQFNDGGIKTSTSYRCGVPILKVVLPLPENLIIKK